MRHTAFGRRKLSRFLLPQTRAIWLTDHVWNLESCMLAGLIYVLKNISLKGQEKGDGTTVRIVGQRVERFLFLFVCVEV